MVLICGRIFEPFDALMKNCPLAGIMVLIKIYDHQLGCKAASLNPSLAGIMVLIELKPKADYTDRILNPSLRGLCSYELAKRRIVSRWKI